MSEVVDRANHENGLFLATQWRALIGAVGAAFRRELRRRR